MARATKEETQSSMPEERKRRKGHKRDDDEPPTINGVPIPEFLWDAPDHYHIFGA